MAASYHMLGTIAQKRGNFDPARIRYQQALDILTGLGDRTNLGRLYCQLGILATSKVEFDQAHTWHQRALEISNDIGDRLGAASSYYALGLLAEVQGDYQEARAWYQRALELFQGIGDQAHTAQAMSAIGALEVASGAPADGVAWSLRSLTIRREMGSPESRRDLRSLARQRSMLGDSNFTRLLCDHGDEELIGTVLEALARRDELGEEEDEDDLGRPQSGVHQAMTGVGAPVCHPG